MKDLFLGYHLPALDSSLYSRPLRPAAGEKHVCELQPHGRHGHDRDSASAHVTAPAVKGLNTQEARESFDARMMESPGP